MIWVQRAVGVLSIAAGVVVSVRSESRVWYGAVLVGLVLLFAGNLRTVRE